MLHSPEVDQLYWLYNIDCLLNYSSLGKACKQIESKINKL